MTLRAYARRRGISAPSVLRAIARGRLAASLVYVAGVAQIADPDLADQEWQRNTDYSKAPGSVLSRAAGAVTPPVTPAVTPPVTPAVTPPVTPPPATAPVTSEAGAEDALTTLFEAARRQKVWQAHMAELEYREAAAELVDRTELTDRWAAICTRVRTKLLGVPGKVKAKHPALTLDQVAAMSAEIRDALEELADGSILHQ